MHHEESIPIIWIHEYYIAAGFNSDINCGEMWQESWFRAISFALQLLKFQSGWLNFQKVEVSKFVNLASYVASQEIPSDLKISEKMWSRLLVICGKCWTMSRFTVKWRFLPELFLLYFIWCGAINQLNPNWAIGYSSLATCAPFTLQSELVCVAMAKALGHGPFLKLAHGPFLISPACTLKWIKLWSG